MSHHIVHIFTHGAMLRQERGFLIMRHGEDEEKRLPLEDVLAVVIAAKGVTFSSNLLSELAGANAVVLHCSERYLPVAMTAPLAHVIRPELVENQANRDLELHRRLWRRVIRDKVANQSAVLAAFGRSAPGVQRELACAGEPDEASAARAYWRVFFELAGEPGSSRDQGSGTPVNGMLNYGYAVLQAIVHRSIVAHGMIPVLGFRHASNYGGDPLVYDLMEPFRPFADLLLIRFLLSPSHETGEALFRLWAKHVASSLVNVRLAVPERGRLKLLNGIDSFISNIANCVAEKSVGKYWEVELETEPLQDGLDNGDV